MPVTNYSIYSAPLVKGMRYGSHASQYLTRVVSGIDAVYGLPVAQSPTDASLAVPVASSNLNFIGIVALIYHNSTVTSTSANSPGDGFPAQKDVDILRQGSIVVETEENVALGDPVFLRHTAVDGSNLVVGKFRKTADSGKTLQLTKAQWLTPSINGLAAVLINYP